MATKTIGPIQMGRPKKNIETVNVRISRVAYDLARQACPISKESAVEYISRVVQDRAEDDLMEDAERRVAYRRMERDKQRMEGNEGQGS